MEQNDKEFQELLSRSRVVFIEELQSKFDSLTILLDRAGNDLGDDTLREILIMFHSIHGTASTLEFNWLAQIGQEGESLIKDFSAGAVEPSFFRGKIILLLAKIRQWLNFSKPGLSSGPSGGLPKEYTNLPEASKILIIDDDTAMLNLVENVFTGMGYTVYICDDSVTAMDIIALSKPDLILLDIMMPKADGYQILAKIKEIPAYSDICVIFLSAMDDIDAKIKGMQAGIDDYITKPFNLREFVSRVEMVLKRANKYKEKLLKDSMTGAYSRSYLNDRFKDELDRYKRNRTVFTGAFIDLDHFKRINDLYGHATGDFVLNKFVEFMLAGLRESDCLFRFGGEEFIVLMPDTDESQTYSALDRLQQIFSMQALSYAGNTIPVTFSCGIKEVDEEDKSVSQFLSRADEAMYAAKNAGRNRIVKYSSLSDEQKNKKTLLLVDDESTILKILKERLLEAGYNIILASNGRQAWEIIEDRLIDAVVLDRILPDMDGVEICRRIKETPMTCNIKVIILSQKSGKEDIVEGLYGGADDYVTKPFSMAELEARIMRVLKR